MKLGTQRPARVLVRFVDERFEGRQEWVPPARLKVSWAAVGVFREREARWDRIDKRCSYTTDMAGPSCRRR
ncbi:MAG: hypothetical protein WBM01_24985 [Mycobacterium sp.]|uniref:hypothetical protein n=1 Tax=Mycobacterium sp. TaxID=1785 RepID=UPI003C76715F